MSETILITLVGSGSALITLFIQKFFSRNADAVTIQSKVIQDLYQEIGRLNQMVQQLQLQEEKAESIEKSLNKRITELEVENKLQAREIKELKQKLSEHVKKT